MNERLAFPSSLTLALTMIALGGCDGTTSGPVASPRDGGGLLSPSPNTLSNTPQAKFWVVENGEAAGLELVSSNLLPDPTSSLNYLQWYGEVKNTGTRTACYIFVTLDFRTPGGTTRVQAVKGVARAYPHTTSKNTSLIPCIPPGKSAGIYANDLPAVPLRLSAIGEVEIHFEQSLIYPDAALALSSPTVDGVAIVEDGGAGHWVVTGTLTATAALASVGVIAYLKDSGGLIVDEVGASQAAVLGVGASWAFKTAAYIGSQPASSLLFVDFRPGT